MYPDTRPQRPSGPAALTRSRGLSSAARNVRLVLALLLALAMSFALQVTAAARADAAPTAGPADPQLAAALDEVLTDPAVTAGHTSVQVRDAADGAELYDRTADDPMKPASNNKLITGAAAMDRLGGDFRFHTDVLATADGHRGTLDGDLTLKGYGDPTSLESDYQGLAADLKKSGVRRVTGKIVADSSYFDAQQFNPHWDRDDEDEYYSAEISALTMAPNTDYDSGTIIVNYAPGEIGKPAAVTVTPASAAGYVRIVNETTTGAAGSDDGFSYDRATGTNTITVSGTVPADGGDRSWVTVSKPQLLAATVFRAALQDQGITVDGGVAEGVAERRSRTLARDWSIPLSEMMTPYMKLSNNMHAEHLTKTLGAEAARRSGKPAAGSWDNGTAEIRKFLVRKGIDTDGFRNVDGSGLAHDDRIRPRMLNDALIAFQSEPWFDTYFASLPIAGNPDRFIGGTLSSRMRNTPAANNLHGKTGSLNGVTALSGYVTGADGRKYVFSMMSEYPVDGTNPKSVEDRLGITLAGWKAGAPVAPQQQPAGVEKPLTRKELLTARG